MKIRPNCAARTHENDIRPIVEISQRAGISIEASTFLGSAQFAGWSKTGPSIICNARWNTL